jgi:adenylosuccinate lyase
MIQRYSRPVMREIWSEQRKLEIWLQIELLASEALCARGLVPRKDFAQMKRRAAFSLERCKELERTLNHDVIAFTTNVAENIGAPAGRWLHFGLTSSDIVDTAFAVQMVQSVDILIADVKVLRKVVAAKARKYRLTPMIGRSHGIHAEPTTFGLKLALMYDEFGRALNRLEAARTTAADSTLTAARRFAWCSTITATTTKGDSC